MTKPFLTVREACAADQLNRSPNWIRAAIRLGKIKAVKAGNTLLICTDELDRVKTSTLKVSRREMLGKYQENT